MSKKLSTFLKACLVTIPMIGLIYATDLEKSVISFSDPLERLTHLKKKYYSSPYSKVDLDVNTAKIPNMRQNLEALATVNDNLLDSNDLMEMMQKYAIASLQDRKAIKDNIQTKCLLALFNKDSGYITKFKSNLENLSLTRLGIEDAKDATYGLLALYVQNIELWFTLGFLNPVYLESLDPVLQGFDDEEKSILTKEKEDQSFQLNQFNIAQEQIKKGLSVLGGAKDQAINYLFQEESDQPKTSSNDSENSHETAEILPPIFTDNAEGKHHRIIFEGAINTKEEVESKHQENLFSIEQSKKKSLQALDVKKQDALKDFLLVFKKMEPQSKGLFSALTVGFWLGTKPEEPKDNSVHHRILKDVSWTAIEGSFLAFSRLFQMTQKTITDTDLYTHLGLGDLFVPGTTQPTTKDKASNTADTRKTATKATDKDQSSDTNEKIKKQLSVSAPPVPTNFDPLRDSTTDPRNQTDEASYSDSDDGRVVSDDDNDDGDQNEYTTTPRYGKRYDTGDDTDSDDDKPVTRKENNDPRYNRNSYNVVDETNDSNDDDEDAYNYY